MSNEIIDSFKLINTNKVLEKKNISAVASPSLSCLRLSNVSGFNNRKNDVIYCRPETDLSDGSVVVYFGGDVQDFLENMENNSDSSNHEYIKWNLENTASLLHSHFPNKHVVVIRPSRMDFGTFSCYENFVPVIKYGTPEHGPMHNALHHLQQLLKTISSRIKGLPNMMGEDIYDLHKCDMTLIGFSKGCVVLNQFIYEFHYVKTLTPDDEHMCQIISRIKEMYWLDSGHSGGKNTWITSRCLLETLASLGIKIQVHVTPYQMCDSKRPWIAMEEKQFTGLLREMNANIERVFHFKHNSVVNLNLHFSLLLTVFKKTDLHLRSQPSSESSIASE